MLGRVDGKTKWVNLAAPTLQAVQKDSKAQARLSIYHDQLSRCHESLSNYPMAISEAKTALDKCQDDQYKNDLARRLTSLESQISWYEGLIIEQQSWPNHVIHPSFLRCWDHISRDHRSEQAISSVNRRVRDLLPAVRHHHFMRPWMTNFGPECVKTLSLI